MNLRALAAVAAACGWPLITGPGAFAAERADFLGVWLSSKGDGAFELRPCGEMLCGYIYSILRVPNPELPMVDSRNEKPALRTRPLCGLQTFGSLKKVSANAWGDGWVYDPETGKSYSVEITLQDSATLSVRGYIGTKLFGETRLYSRPRTALQKCSSSKNS